MGKFTGAVKGEGSKQPVLFGKGGGRGESSIGGGAGDH